MANPKHLELARQGKDAWNKWRKENPDEPADFSGTDFTLPENRGISFEGFRFRNATDFTNCNFCEETYFEGSIFNFGADFSGSMFGHGTSFEGVLFLSVATFTDTIFVGDANFSGTTFSNHVAFKGTSFMGEIGFNGTTFFTQANFTLAAFLKPVSFYGWSVKQLSENRHLHFSDDEYFQFQGSWDRIPTKPDSFPEVLFIDTIFKSASIFTNRTFEDEANFTNAIFGNPPDFSGTKGHARLNFVGARFVFGDKNGYWTTDSKIVNDLRRLRGITKEIYAVDAERDLFILERQAERGVLWKQWWDGTRISRRFREPWDIWRSRLFEWWRPLTPTVLIFFYSTLSNFGRSILRPLFWLVVANVGAFFIYARLADHKVNDALWNLTFSNLLPFGTLAKPLAEHAAAELFYGGVLPPGVGLTAIFQGVVNALLVFLLALALRNHFKVK